MISLIPMVTGAEVAFWLLAPIMILGALGLVLAKRPVHSALCLAVVMISLAIQYAALEAPFLFAVQIIVYTGAILMLFLFVLMLVGVDAADSLVETIKGQRVLAGIAGLGFAVLLIGAVGNAIVGNPLGLTQANAGLGEGGFGGNAQGLAALIFNDYVFAFEATAALLITAAVGAMVLAHRERLKEKKSQRDLSGERMRRYAETGEHPGALPTPGVFARHNGVHVPALLPDGTVSEKSVSQTLKARGTVLDARDLTRPIEESLKSVAGDKLSIYRPPPTPETTARPELVEGQTTEGGPSTGSANDNSTGEEEK
ncbi:NADH-quinone oxidoreductase subunit J [Microlunatus speluncae]|uniref:NADH-quinone oxidoreductase subunit J n=1 Tax=Microlunatus speluncae TaxID=2594267 RepID=UPI00126635C1|nr:NADH-quinone oxidoreductase subunit J [Microlunatus speluncae]